MRDENKTKAQIIRELEKLRQKVIDLEAISINITEHKEVEETLKNNEQEKTAILDSLVEHVVHQDRDMKILWANKAACESVHIKREDLLGRYCYEIWAGRRSPCDDCPIIKARETGQSQMVEKMTPNGRWWYIQGHLIRDDNGHVTGTTELTLEITDRKQADEAVRNAKDKLEIKVGERTAKLIETNEKLKQEIEERKRAEAALRINEERFKSIFKNLLIGFYRTTPDGRIIDANQALFQMLGYASVEELAAVNLESEAYHPEYSRRQFKENIQRDGEIKGLESHWKKPDGTLVFIRENARAIRDDDGNITCYEGTIEDISDQMQAEKQIRSLSHQLIQAQESERQMISRELHDCVAQDLSILMISLNTLFDHQPNISSEVQNKALEFSELLKGTIRSVRDLSYELRLPGLDGMGLCPALSMYCEEFAEKSGLKVDFRATGMSTLRLDFDTKMNLYRLIQEGLNNIRKHAAASQATVKLVGAYPNIILRIEDDGKGFDIEERARTADSEKRMGLRSMAERVRLIQGEMAIQSQSMKGTRIFLKFPYQEKK